MLAQVAEMIEMAGLQISAGRSDVGQGRLGENLGGDVLDRAIRDFMNEADIPVLTRRDPGNDLAPGDSRIDDEIGRASCRERV